MRTWPHPGRLPRLRLLSSVRPAPGPWRTFSTQSSFGISFPAWRNRLGVGRGSSPPCSGDAGRSAWPLGPWALRLVKWLASLQCRLRFAFPKAAESRTLRSEQVTPVVTLRTAFCSLKKGVLRAGRGRPGLGTGASWALGAAAPAVPSPRAGCVRCQKPFFTMAPSENVSRRPLSRMADDRGGSEGPAGVLPENRAPGRLPPVPGGGRRPPGSDRGPAVLLIVTSPADLLSRIQKEAAGVSAPPGPPAAVTRWPRGRVGRRRGVTALAWALGLGHGFLPWAGTRWCPFGDFRFTELNTSEFKMQNLGASCFCSVGVLEGETGPLLRERYFEKVITSYREREGTGSRPGPDFGPRGLMILF